jgi:hypothetical protein
MSCVCLELLAHPASLERNIRELQSKAPYVVTSEVLGARASPAVYYGHLTLLYISKSLACEVSGLGGLLRFRLPIQK